jgi:hypothetical protein
MMQHHIQRAALGALLLLAILVPATCSVWHPEPAAPDALRAFLTSRGLHITTVSDWGTDQPVFNVSMAGCAGPIRIFAVSSLMEDQNFIESRLPSKSVRTFFYLDKSRTTLDRMEIWTLYAGAQARNIVRSRPLTYLDNMIEVVSPSRCEALKSIDWGKFWGDE